MEKASGNNMNKAMCLEIYEQKINETLNILMDKFPQSDIKYLK
jgi:hypothetical protein